MGRARALKAQYGTANENLALARRFLHELPGQERTSTVAPSGSATATAMFTAAPALTLVPIRGEVMTMGGGGAIRSTQMTSYARLP